MSRLKELRDMRAARVDFKGRPLPGFSANVKAIDAEIERLEQSGDEEGLHGNG